MHYAVHNKDRGVWGRPAVCGKKKPLTKNRDKVTCPKCIRMVEWDRERYYGACVRQLSLAVGAAVAGK